MGGVAELTREQVAAILADGGILPPMEDCNDDMDNRSPRQDTERGAGGRPLNLTRDDAVRRARGVPRAKGGEQHQDPTRFETLNTMIDFTMRNLKGAEFKVWMTLFRDAKKKNGWLAVTGQCDIAKRAGVSPRAVTKAVRSLSEKGLLEVVRQGGLQRGISHYRVIPASSRARTPVPPAM